MKRRRRPSFDVRLHHPSIHLEEKQYRPRQSFPAGTDPDAIAAGDFNGDGWMDIVVVNSLSSGKATFAVLLNDGNW